MPEEIPQKSRPVATGFLLLYFLFLGACAFVTLVDPPWKQSGLEGVFGFLASMAAGLPWSLFLIHVIRDCTACGSFPGGSDVLTVVLAWGAALLNLVGLAIAAGWAEVPPESPRRQPPAVPSLSASDPVARPQAAAAAPSGPRVPLRVQWARMVQATARNFDAVRQSRRVTAIAVVLTVLTGLPAFMGLLAAGRGAEGTLAFWSAGVLVAMAGSWCRLLSSNRELHGSYLRFGVALAGTACGTALALLVAASWAPYAPAWALFMLPLAGCQGYLLVATMGSRLVSAL